MCHLLIGCEVLLRELADAIARSPHAIDVEFLPKGAADLGGTRTRDALQTAVDRADPARHGRPGKATSAPNKHDIDQAVF